MSKYTQDEIDHVIDKMDLGFIKNRIKKNEEEVNAIMNTLVGASALTTYRIKKAIRSIFYGKN